MGRLDGKVVNFRRPTEAREAGIETVYQDLALVELFDLADNDLLRDPASGQKRSAKSDGRNRGGNSESAACVLNELITIHSTGNVHRDFRGKGALLVEPAMLTRAAAAHDRFAELIAFGAHGVGTGKGRQPAGGQTFAVAHPDLIVSVAIDVHDLHSQSLLLAQLPLGLGQVSPDGLPEVR